MFRRWNKKIVETKNRRKAVFGLTKVWGLGIV